MIGGVIMLSGWLKNPKRKLYLKKLYKKSRVLWRVEMAREQGVKVGKNCRFYSASFFSEPYLVEIGNNVIISGNVIFLTHDGAIYLFKKRNVEVGGTFGRITVGDNCFIGMGAIINRNVTIGNNCIIGAGAVVRNDIPDNSVAAGNPAKVVYKTSLIGKLLIFDKNTINQPFKDKEHKRRVLEAHFGIVKKT